MSWATRVLEKVEGNMNLFKKTFIGCVILDSQSTYILLYKYIYYLFLL